jgi:hypothetical protein
MRETGGSYVLSQATLAGKRLGPGTALVDEDMLRLLLTDAPDGEKAVQIRYDAVIGVGLSDGSVVISGRDGRTLVVATKEAGSFRQAVLAACRALPEVTRALRALGSRRSLRGIRRSPGDREGRFFAPFIAARRASMEARDAASVIASFDARQLKNAVEASIEAFAAELSNGHPARHRAMEAQLSDGLDPLAASLDRLAELSQRAAADVDDLGRWRAWAEGVQGVFESADRSWVEIEPVVQRP